MSNPKVCTVAELLFALLHLLKIMFSLRKPLASAIHGILFLLYHFVQRSSLSTSSKLYLVCSPRRLVPFNLPSTKGFWWNHYFFARSVEKLSYIVTPTSIYSTFTSTNLSDVIKVTMTKRVITDWTSFYLKITNSDFYIKKKISFF